MSAKFFGQWLVEKNLITPKQLLQANDLQKEHNVTLGQAAIRLNYLNNSQVEMINLDQQRHDKRFGEIAQEKGLISNDQMSELLTFQKDHNIFFGEAVSQLGFLSEEQVNQEVEAHRQSQQQHQALIDSSFDDIKEPDFVRAFLDVTIKLFTRMIQDTVKIESLANVSMSSLSEPCYIQKAHGDRNFHYLITLPEQSQLAVASKILNMDMTEVNEVVLDAAREFVNIITGSGCVKMSDLGFELSLDPAEILNPNDHFPPHFHAVMTEMTSTNGKFKVGFLFE